MQDIKGAGGLCGLGLVSQMLNINPECKAYPTVIRIAGEQMPGEFLKNHGLWRASMENSEKSEEIE